MMPLFLLIVHLTCCFKVSAVDDAAGTHEFLTRLQPDGAVYCWGCEQTLPIDATEFLNDHWRGCYGELAQFRDHKHNSMYQHVGMNIGG